MTAPPAGRREPASRAKSPPAKVARAESAARPGPTQSQLLHDRALPSAELSDKKTVEVGQNVSPGQQLMVVVPLDDIWVTADFKETQLKQHEAGPEGEVQRGRLRTRVYTGT